MPNCQQTMVTLICIQLKHILLCIWKSINQKIYIIQPTNDHFRFFAKNLQSFLVRVYEILQLHNKSYKTGDNQTT